MAPGAAEASEEPTTERREVEVKGRARRPRRPWNGMVMVVIESKVVARMKTSR